MLLLHLSDLHLTRYGETRYWTHLQGEDGSWEPLNTWKGWRVEGRRDRKQRPETLRLIDPRGIVHDVRKWPRGNDDKAVSRMVQLAMERHLTSVEALIKNRPDPDDLRSLLRIDPQNANLRFLQLLDEVLPLQPELIAITGDITDNGFGYGLVEHYLGKWIEQRRLYVIPGNHDTYDMIPRRGRKSRIALKVDAYRDFAERVGCGPEDHGAYVRYLEDLAIVGLSSCKASIAPLSASGEVSDDQLEWLRELAAQQPDFRRARFRLCLVHHHLLRMPMELGKRSPIEVGLRLRNAKDVMKACVDANIDILLNGHRHHGYMVQLPWRPTVISSPSSTLGCHSTGMRYVWLAELNHRYPHPSLHKISDEPATAARDDD